MNRLTKTSQQRHEPQKQSAVFKGNVNRLPQGKRGYNWTKTEQRMGTEAGRGSCHSALLLCKEEKTQTVSDAWGKGEE